MMSGLNLGVLNPRLILLLFFQFCRLLLINCILRILNKISCHLGQVIYPLCALVFNDGTKTLPTL